MPTTAGKAGESRRGGSRRRTSAASEPTSEWAPMLSGSDGIVPGEVLLTLHAAAAANMTASVPVHPARFAGAAANLGVDDLDSVLADLGAHDITQLAPSPVGIAGVASVGLAGATTAESGLEAGVDDQPMSRTFRVRIDPSHDVEQAAAQLAEVASVEVAEPNRWRESVATPNDPMFGSQWGLTKINGPAAWDITTGSSSVVVGIIDSGCDLDHPELAPLLVSGFDMVDLGPNPTPPPGFRFEGDFSGRDNIPEDEVGHGTHVAGTIAALSNNATQVTGVGWQTRLMPVKALTRMVRISDGQVRGVGSSADVAAAVTWAVDHGAHVLNMSLGADAQTTVEANAIAYAVSKGVLVVAAMGNNGSGNPSYPAAYPGVLAVGAIDSNDKKATFSQTGAHIGLVAPGVGILSTYLAGGTATLSGTSMATPHVAGVAALVKAVKPSASASEIADILRTTARPLRDDPADPVPNDRYGHGCLDAHAAVVKAQGPVINPTITIRLRTPIIPCQPVTQGLPFCPPRTPLLGCPPLTVDPRFCPPPPTKNPVICPPITRNPQVCPVTRPPFCLVPTPTITITRTPTTPVQNPPGGQPQPGAAGYDPYGLFGPAGTAAQFNPAGTAAPEGTDQYQAGYAAGYAAALAAVEATVQAAEVEAMVQAAESETGAAAEPSAGEPGGVEAAGPGDIFQPYPITRLRSVLIACWPPITRLVWNCPPRTIGYPECPIPTPTYTITYPTTPQLGQPGFGFGEAGYGEGGYDPYGQNPFQG